MIEYLKRKQITVVGVSCSERQGKVSSPTGSLPESDIMRIQGSCTLVPPSLFGSTASETEFGP